MLEMKVYVILVLVIVRIVVSKILTITEERKAVQAAIQKEIPILR